VQGSLLDFELQYHNGSDWVTLERFTEDPKTFKVYTPITRTSVDSFYSDRWIFEYHGQPVKTDRIRLLVHEATWEVELRRLSAKRAVKLVCTR